MATRTEWMTAEQLLPLPDEQRCGNLVDGEFRATGFSSELCGCIVATTAMLVEQYARRHQRGKTFVRPGYVLSRNPDTVLAPDVAFTCAGRLPNTIAPTFSDIIPDLVVEVISSDNTHEKVEEKTARWLAAGVQVVWNVRPDDCTVSVHAAGGTTLTLAENDVLDGGELLPGFACRVSELFA